MNFVTAQPLFIFSIILLVSAVVGVFLLRIKNRSLKKLTEDLQDQKRRTDYKLKCLIEISLKFGLSLDIKELVETLMVDLHEFMPYTTASYILIDSNKLYFTTKLNDGVSKEYIAKVKSDMLESLKLITTEDVALRQTEEILTGHVLNDLNKVEPILYFNIPLRVNGEVLGVFNVSSIKSSIYKRRDIKLLYEIFKHAMDTLSSLSKLVGREKGKLQVMVNSMYDGVLMIDKKYRIIIVNPACYSLMGMNPEFNLNIFDVFDYFSGVFPLEEKITQVLASGKVETVSELKIAERYFEVIVIPVMSGDEIIGVGILIHDSSKEMELKKLRQEFTAMMVHELRSPLSVIKGTSDLLLKEQANLTPEQVSSFLTQIKDSSISLLGIVNELLDASKIESGKIELFKKLSDLNKILTDEFNYYFNLAREKGINLSFDLDQSVQKFYFDENKVKQVMNNLLSNSIKFTESGGSIVIASKNYGTYIGVSVVDTGKGVPDEVKEKLFQKFVQAREANPDGVAGTGLGLAICKGIIDAHGGRIWIEDNQPRGARFIFTLPIA